MSRWVAFWAACIAVLIAVDIYRDSKHDGSTLSESVRAVKNKAPAGDLIFSVLWLGFAKWFHRHILER